MGFRITEFVLASAVADAGTVTIPYPAGTNQAFFTGANASADGAVTLNDNDVFRELVSGVRVNFTYGGSDITLTNNTGVTWPAGTRVRAQLGLAGNDTPTLRPGNPVADAVAVGGTFAQAEVNAVVTQLNRLLRELRAQGVIRT
jgi:hypothetical protein